MTTRYMHKRVYKYPRYELTIPVQYKDLAEEFMNKNLIVDARREGNDLVIVARTTEDFVTKCSTTSSGLCMTRKWQEGIGFACSSPSQPVIELLMRLLPEFI